MSDFPPDVKVYDIALDPNQNPVYALLRFNWELGMPPSPPPLGLAPGALGIDISHWQSDARPIDWGLVGAQAKPAFVFIKASDGLNFIDDWLPGHRDGARSIGLAYGFYHYLRPGSSGADQADYFLTSLAGDVGNLPLVADVEEGNLSLWEVRAFVDRLIERVDGKQIIIYTRASLWSAIGGDNPDLPEFRDCLIWVAHPNAATPLMPSDWATIGYDFWQINWASRLPGIAGDVDVNVFAGAPKPWYIRDIPYKAKPKISGAAVPLYKTPGGALDRILNIAWESDVLGTTLNGWLKVSPLPLWVEEKYFKL